MSVSIATLQTCRSIDYTISVIHPSNDTCRVFTSPGCCRLYLDHSLSLVPGRRRLAGLSLCVGRMPSLFPATLLVLSSLLAATGESYLSLSLCCFLRGIYAKKTRVYCVKQMSESRVSLVVRFKIRSLCLNINWRHCIECNEIHCSPCVLFKHSSQCRHM